MVASATHTVRRNAHASLIMNHTLHSRSAKASCRATLTHICIPCTEAPLHDSVAARSCVRSGFNQTELRWEPTTAIRPCNRERSAWERRPQRPATHNAQPSRLQAELLPRDLASFHSVSDGAPSAAAARTGAGPDLRGPFDSWLNGGASRLPLREIPRQRLVAEPLCGWPALPTSGQLSDGGTLPMR